MPSSTGISGSTYLFIGVYEYLPLGRLTIASLTLLQIVCPLYGISLFLPTIIRQLGYQSSQAQLMTGMSSQRVGVLEAGD